MEPDPNDPRPMYHQGNYDPRPEEQRPNFGYDPTPKRIPEPYEIAHAPSPPERIPYQGHEGRREIVVPVPSGGVWFALGALLLVLFILITPIHASASADYQVEVMEASYQDFSHWDLENPATWTVPDVNIPEPSWFVKNGGRMMLYFQWIGILLLFIGVYKRINKMEEK